MLREKFRQFGEITYCEMKGNDVGVIQFSDVRHAKEAVGILFKTNLLLKSRYYFFFILLFQKEDKFF